jgi:hypothetical protein
MNQDDQGYNAWEGMTLESRNTWHASNGLMQLFLFEKEE